MPDFVDALIERLNAAAPVNALVGSRVYRINRPQNSVNPSIRLQVISDPRPEHLGGYDGARQSRVQVDCFADKSTTARDLAEKVISAVATPASAAGVVFGRIKAEGPRDLGEDVAGIGFVHRASLDLLVEHRLA